MGWQRKSNFADKIDEAVQLTTARQLGRILINTKHCLYSQWFPGDFNTVSDSLSSDLSLPADILSNILSMFALEQVLFGFKNTSFTNRNRFMADLSAVQSAANGAVVNGAAAKQTRAWNRYKRYLFSNGLHDNWFRENFSRGAKHTILSAFTQSVREG